MGMNQSIHAAVWVNLHSNNIAQNSTQVSSTVSFIGFQKYTDITYCLGVVLCGKMIKKSKGTGHKAFRIGLHPGGDEETLIRRMHLGRDTGDFSGVLHVLFLNLGGYIFI